MFEKGADYDELGNEFRIRKPIQEAEADCANRDFRVYSAMGVGLYFPGLDYESGQTLADEHGEIRIPYTTDAVESSEHSRYITTAVEFARSYNRHKESILLTSEAETAKPAEQAVPPKSDRAGG